MRIAVVAVVLVLTGAAAAYAERGPARLALVSDAPVVVAGTGFRPYERVRLLISAPEPRSRTVRAGARGRFRVALALTMPRCGGLVVQALGSRGSRAFVDRSGVDCAPVG